MVDATFLALSVLTIGSAIAALELRSLIYGSIALMGTLGGIAGFFLLLRFSFRRIIPSCCVCRFYCSFNFVYCDVSKKRINFQTS